ncbi:MAG: hypothetical protein M1812_002160 [Candelaria pacifica]|nr:MAG: hypothetical protein M1812_002160 [Candelaria pacifica]
MSPGVFQTSMTVKSSPTSQTVPWVWSTAIPSPRVTSINCSEPAVLVDWKPNSDIAGIGVFIAFSVSAWATLVLVILHTLLNRKQTQNPIDLSIIEWICRLYVKFTPNEWNNIRRKPQEMWTEAIEAGVLVFSDTQNLSGIAILVSGYIQLSSGLDLYQWEILVDLAWFSSSTHLTTLTALREFFRQRTPMAVIRTICMGFNLVLLLVAMVPLGYSSSGSASPAHAVCLFELNLSWARVLEMQEPPNEYFYSMRPFNTPFVAIAWTFLLASYAIRIVRLFDWSVRQARRYLRSWPGDHSARIYTGLRIRRNSVSRRAPRKALSFLLFLFRAAYVLANAVFDVAETMTYEISHNIASVS